MKDVAKFQQELEKKQNVGEELRRQAAESQRIPTTTVIPEGEAAMELDRWRKKSVKQEVDLVRSVFIIIMGALEVVGRLLRIRGYPSLIRTL